MEPTEPRMAGAEWTALAAATEQLALAIGRVPPALRVLAAQIATEPIQYTALQEEPPDASR